MQKGKPGRGLRHADDLLSTNPPPHLLGQRLRVRLRRYLVVVALSYGAGLVFAALFYPDEGLGWYLRSGGIGLCIGAGLMGFSLFYLHGTYGRRIRRLPLMHRIVLISVAAVIIVVIMRVVGLVVFFGIIDVAVLFDMEELPRSILYSLGVFALLSTIVGIGEIVGWPLLGSFVLGRYAQPVREDRIFMFLDVEASSGIAERLGNVGTHALLTRFFFDIAEPILEYGGETHRYIGDEVVITWRLAEGIRDGRCLRCALAVFALIENEAETYRKAFGLVPRFRVGLHGGPVVSGECGDNKREIVYFGNTINTAARLVGVAKELHHPVVISSSLLDRLPGVGEASITRLGSVRLRGQSESIDVAAVYPGWWEETEDRQAAHSK